MTDLFNDILVATTQRNQIIDRKMKTQADLKKKAIQKAIRSAYKFISKSNICIKTVNAIKAEINRYEYKMEPGQNRFYIHIVWTVENSEIIKVRFIGSSHCDLKYATEPTEQVKLGQFAFDFKPIKRFEIFDHQDLIGELEYKRILPSFIKTELENHGFNEVDESYAVNEIRIGY